MKLIDLIEKRRKEYKNIGKIYCPVIRCDVHFNYRGWRHLLYRENRSARNRGDLSRRLSLFPQAKKIMISRRCTIRLEAGDRFLNTYLQKGKITVMLQRKIGSSITYYYSIWDN